MFSKLISIIFVAGFLTACGASGSGQADPDPISNGPSSNATISSTPTSVAASSVMSQASSIANSVTSQASSVTSQVTVSSSSRSSSLMATSSSRISSVNSSSRSSMSSARSSSSRSSMSSSRSSSSVAVSSSSRSSSSRSSSRSSSSSSIATQPVTIQWSHPTQRENGDYLELNEIAGYEIRVRPANSSTFSSYPISGNQTTSYVLNNYVATMIVEIAVYDTEGLYSEFVAVNN